MLDTDTPEFHVARRCHTISIKIVLTNGNELSNFRTRLPCNFWMMLGPHAVRVLTLHDSGSGATSVFFLLKDLKSKTWIWGWSPRSATATSLYNTIGKSQNFPWLQLTIDGHRFKSSKQTLPFPSSNSTRSNTVSYFWTLNKPLTFAFFVVQDDSLP